MKTSASSVSRASKPWLKHHSSYKYAVVDVDVVVVEAAAVVDVEVVVDECIPLKIHANNANQQEICN